MGREQDSLNPSEIESVAKYLINKEETILKEWEDQIKSKTDQPNSLESLSRTEFYNSIPDFIKELKSAFQEDYSFLAELSRTHGSQRYEYGFDLRSLIEEWSVLYLILMKQLNKAERAVQLEKEKLKEFQRRLAHFVHQAIRNSVDEYFSLQQLKAESQIEDLEAALQEHSELNTQRGHNLQSASHDVGGSMVVLKMNLSLLKNKELSEDAREIVDQLSIATDNLSQLLNNLLELFRLEAGRESLELKDFDVAELLNELGANIQSLAEAKGLELKLNGQESLPVHGDPVKVKRIAQNLILNSLKYTDTGHIEINWKVVDENYWMLEIADTGPGIDPTNAALFTERDKTRKKSATGPSLSKNQGPEEVRMHSEGIGLLIVRQLCQLLNSVVKVDIDRPTGTSFKINIPRKFSDSEPNPD